MVVSCLADTGAILALLDRDDRWHDACLEVFRHLPLPLMTSTAVLTELFHLVRRSRMEIETAWTFLRSDTVILAPIYTAELSEIHALMSRYWDRPMDFADATLVHLAKREKIATIFTIDHSDFETYRIEGKRKFRIVPGRRP
jgi:predicted nucleic acid-binding protein